MNVQFNKGFLQFNCFSCYNNKFVIACFKHKCRTLFIWSLSVKYEIFGSSSSVVIMSLPRIVSYLPLVYLSTWHAHVTIFFALNSGKQKSIFTFFEVVNFPDWVYHLFFSASFVLSFDVSLPITTVILIPLSNRIRKFLNFSLPIQVFMQPCRIGE